jgi:hypothetical protein
MLKPGPLCVPEMIVLASLAQCCQTNIDRELLEILQGRFANLVYATDRLARLIGLVDEITRAVVSSQSLMDRLNTEDSASAAQSAIM